MSVWDVATRSRLAALPAVPAGGSMRLAGDGNRLATIAPDGRVAVFDVGAATAPACVLTARTVARELAAEPVATARSLAAVAASRDGERLAFSTADRVLVVDVARCATLLDEAGAARSLAFDRGGGVVAASDGEAIRVWAVAPRRTLATIPTGHSILAGAVAVTSDGALVATAGGVWSVATGRQLAAWLIPGHHIAEPMSTTPVERATPPSSAAITDDNLLVTAAPSLGITTYDVSGEPRTAATVSDAVARAVVPLH